MFIHLVAFVFFLGNLRGSIVWSLFYAILLLSGNQVPSAPLSPARLFSALWVQRESTKGSDEPGVHLLLLRGAQLGRKAGKFCSQTTQSTPHQATAVTSQQFFPRHLRHIFHSLRIDVLTLIKTGGGWQNYPHTAGAQMHQDVKGSGFNWAAIFCHVVFYTQGLFALYGQ